MKIRLFGALSVETGNQVRGPSDFGGLKTKQILEILLLARGHLVSKDTLADALWADRLPQNVTATLETYVSLLRKHLSPDREFARRLVVTLPGAYRLDDELIWVDAWRFDDLIQQADRTEGPARVILLSEAVSLVRGDLLEDAPYAEWVEPERRRYRELAVRANLRISAESLSLGDAVASLRHAEAALRLDRMEERAWQAVMRAHHALGHGDAAKRALAECRQILHSELGVEPRAETVLASAGDNHALAPLITRPPAAAAVAAPAAAGSDRRVEDRHLPFLGRTQEIDHLLEVVEWSSSGHVQLVLIDARSGMGRSTLLDHLQLRVSARVGRCTYSHHDVDLPSPPLSVALQAALASTAPDAARRYANFEIPTDAPDRPGFLEKLLRDNGFTVLLLDDLQWADDETLSVIESLATPSSDLPLTIIGTVRRDVPRFADVVAALTSASRMQLGPLSESDLVHLTPAHGHTLLQMSGGHPGFMADHWRWISNGHTGYSPSLTAAVKRQVAGLGPAIAEMLRVASTLPEPVESFDLVDALRRPVADITADLLQALHLGVLELHDGGFRFREPAVRSILRATVPPDRRAVVAQTRRGPGRRLTDSDLASIAAASRRRAAPAAPLDSSRVGTRTCARWSGQTP